MQKMTIIHRIFKIFYFPTRLHTHKPLDGYKLPNNAVFCVERHKIYLKMWILGSVWVIFSFFGSISVPSPNFGGFPSILSRFWGVRRGPGPGGIPAGFRGRKWESVKLLFLSVFDIPTSSTRSREGGSGEFCAIFTKKWAFFEVKWGVVHFCSFLAFPLLAHAAERGVLWDFRGQF